MDHIYKVAVDIAYVGRVFIQYENLFGRNLKALIAEPAVVDNLMRKCYRMLNTLVRTVDYDMFSPSNWENWAYSLEMFNKHLEMVEMEAKTVIDQSINSLLSTEKGIALLHNANTIDTRPELKEFVCTKHENLLRFFITEIGNIEAVFTANKKTPPMPRLQPAKISAINWARLLGRKLKNAVMAFKILEDDPALKNSFLKRSAFKQYFEVMTRLYQFEKMLFERFMQNATFIVNHTNRSNILQIQICKEETREYRQTIKVYT